jgi:4-hydroxybenzoate polyprenyltransferase
MVILYQLIIQSNFYVAWMITSLAFFVQQVFIHTYNIDLLGFIFFSSWFYYSLANQNIFRFEHHKTKNYIFISICLSMVLCFLVTLNFTVSDWIFLFILGSIGFLYLFSIFSINLREIPFLKAFVIAFVVSAFIFFHLIHWENASFDFNYFLFYFSVYFYLLGVAILFDIKDIPIDILHQIKTFPIFFGINKTKAIVILCFLISFVFLHFSSEILLSTHLFSFSMTLFLTGFFALFLTEKSPTYFYTFLLESFLGLPLLINYLYA